MRLDFQPWGETLAELSDAARRAEAAGAGVVWVPELHRSAIVAAAAIAVATTSVGIGTGIALAFARSPMVTALSALDLDELSGGRFRLGLGAGVRRLNESWHDAVFEPPLTRMRDTVEIVRRVVALAHTGDPIVHSGSRSISVRGWRRPYSPARPAIPVYLAGVGPAMTALAGEVGDGWLSHELCPPDVLRTRILPRLSAGAARSGNRPEVVVSACCSVDPDPGRALDRARSTVGFYAGVQSYAELFAAYPDEHAAAVTALRSGTPAEALGHLVSREMAAAFTLSGTPDEVAARLSAYEGIADAVKLSPPTYGLPPEEIRAAQDRLIELLGGLS
ncbi:LLM class flavin-dependent oxidoreductase [Hamadaea tsunoensis]|uniref:LLM class flavin-dependent oxidoreductase n=1 Tax=Hamadaea tsunoensis TaxID=53368 RepID=UPI000410F041|nr:LLM class flavin-dependent oxidoreductase [Hamadaea tsunoensis]